MSETIHVSGEAHIQTGTGSANALENLGVSVDGVEIELIDSTEPVFTDTFGPDVPFDEQQFLQIAVIRAQLVWFDEAVLAKIRSRPGIKAGGAEGTLGNAGLLWGQSGVYFRTKVLSPLESPYNFAFTRLRNSFPGKFGTRRTLWNLEWLAIPYTGTAGATVGTVLYTRS